VFVAGLHLAFFPLLAECRALRARRGCREEVASAWYMEGGF
jgi:hypothetical protein